MRHATEAERPAAGRPAPSPRPSPRPSPTPRPSPVPRADAGRSSGPVADVRTTRPTGRALRHGNRTALLVAMLMVTAGLGLLLWSAWRPAASEAAAPVTSGPSAVAAAPSGSAARVATGAIVPARLSIPAIGVNAPVDPRGTVRYQNPFTGQTVDGFGVPASMYRTAWWSDGPKPGSGQMAVILGHEQVGGGYGVFNRLHTLRPGDAVDLFDRSGAVLHLRVLTAPLTGLSKSTPALADALNGHPPGADVALVTCGGQFDRTVRQSEDNTVVFAAIVR